MPSAKRSLGTMNILSSLQNVDHALFAKITGLTRCTSCIPVARIFSKTGDGLLHVLVAIVLMMLHPMPELVVLALATTMLLERALYWPLKNSLKRLRPPEKLNGFNSVVVASDRFSFPSGHSSAAFALAILLSLAVGGFMPVLLIWASCVALSRVVLGVHFPGDIIAGALLGAAAAFTNAAYWGLI